MLAQRRLHPLPSLRDRFAADPSRAARMQVGACGMTLDYSKNLLDEHELALLLRLAEEAGVAGRIRAMFDGERINTTEARAVLHVALRCPPGTRWQAGGSDVAADVHAVRARMRAFSLQVRSGEWRGHGGERITDVVNIGIGGSDLGPVMVAGRNPLKSEVRVGAVIAMADGPFGRARQRMPTAFLSACSNGSPLSGR